MRLLGDRLRQTGLFQQHRHGVGFAATPGGGDRGAGHRLGQDLLGKFEERLMVLVRRVSRFITFVGGAGQQSR